MGPADDARVTGPRHDAWMKKKPVLPPELDKRFDELEAEIADLETAVIEKKYELYKVWHSATGVSITLRDWYLGQGRYDLFRRRYEGG